MHAYEVPPLSRLERMVLDADVDFDELGFDGTCDRIREHIRSEIAQRRRERARRERVEVACRDCGEPTDVSPSYAEKVARGSVPLPLCLDCRSPTRAAREDAEVVKFVEQLGEQARELAVALAALR